MQKFNCVTYLNIKEFGFADFSKSSIKIFDTQTMKELFDFYPLKDNTQYFYSAHL